MEYGSYLIAEDLNTSDLQWLYLLEEHHDYIIRIFGACLSTWAWSA